MKPPLSRFFKPPHPLLNAVTEKKPENIFPMLQRAKVHRRRLRLEEEVAELQAVLEKEKNLNRILRCALHGEPPTVCRSCLPPSVPSQVRTLLAEIAIVEEEIAYLERRVEDLKISLSQESEEQEFCDFKRRQLLRGSCSVASSGNSVEPPVLIDIRCQTPNNRRCASLVSVSDTSSVSSAKPKEYGRSCNVDNSVDTPNKLSEQLVKILISIFQKLHQSSTTHPDSEEDTVAMLNITCMSSRSFVSRSVSDTQSLDPYGVLSDGEERDIGPYKKLVHFTKCSLDTNRIILCLPAIQRLRVLLHKLCDVELSFLTYKQKLAFWINIYNACIMHAFLQQGVPDSPEKHLQLLNKAALNVGGTVLNALAIEHFILRHSPEATDGAIDGEGFLRHAYGLGYPEPNITFALCRGSWSSPALRIYTAENVANELERAKIEYLEAAVAITSRKKIVMPRLLLWHMRDFADDIESLLEWTYSQLPRSGSSLKSAILECLSGDTKIPLVKMVEIQPNKAEFRYLLPF